MESLQPRTNDHGAPVCGATHNHIVSAHEVVADLTDQIAAGRGDRLRVLIVGAGVAGSALAGLLGAGGLHPVVIERAAPDASAGYMLGLLPIVEPVLRRLGVLDIYRARSLAIRRYRVRGRHGQLLREFDFGTALGGRCYAGMTRADLLDVLGSTTRICRGATIAALRQGSDEICASIRAGDQTIEASFDLLVGADGLHSTVRSLVLATDEVSGFDTHVAGWVAWVDRQPEPPAFEEVWGSTFVGSYPVPGRTGVFVGGPVSAVKQGPAAFVHAASVRLRSLSDAAGAAMAAVIGSDTYLWRFEDRRAASWHRGRVVLLGDAAVGFLPTAGVGAAMATESAGVLATVLRAASAETLVARLAEFERRQRPRCEYAQDGSRQLAQVMFQRNLVMTAVRDLSVRLLPARVVTRPLRRLLDDAPALP